MISRKGYIEPGWVSPPFEKGGAGGDFGLRRQSMGFKSPLTPLCQRGERLRSIHEPGGYDDFRKSPKQARDWKDRLDSTA